MTQAQHYKPADVRRLLLHTPVPRRKRDRWAAYSAFTNHVLPYVTTDTNIFLKRLIIYRPLLYNEDGDEK